MQVWTDAYNAIERLATAAPMLKDCDKPELAFHGYKKILFSKHDYCMLYIIKGNEVYIDRIYHSLQDYSKLPD
ncbi:MAG: type II toxin-antitoxin system RelE/ParE family toxin [Lachnospiraceae bacterium]|nr:type II toxin-antitoxin system RelE/ParE family toxin [Lachnospiraceae bacterium]